MGTNYKLDVTTLAVIVARARILNSSISCSFTSMSHGTDTISKFFLQYREMSRHLNSQILATNLSLYMISKTDTGLMMHLKFSSRRQTD
jgi:hypothetical protein